MSKVEKEIIPSRKECLMILKKNNVPENIVKHSIKVEQFALQIARAIIKQGTDVNERLVSAASLLHDLDKAETLNCDKMKHGLVAYERLKKQGMHSVAEIVRKHVLESILKGELKTIEEKIVYYADKRVIGDRIVDLDERFDYLKKRYGLNNRKTMDIIDKSYSKVVKLEKELSAWMKGKN